MSIGSVSVDIVPDARGFPERLRADLDRQRLSVKIGVDVDDTALRARLQALSGHQVDIRVNLTGAATRDINSLSRSLERLRALEASIQRDITVRVKIEGDENAIRDINRLGRSLDRIVGTLRAVGNPLHVRIIVEIFGDREAIIRLGQIAEARRAASGNVREDVSGNGLSLLKVAASLAPALIPLGAAFAAAGAAAVAGMGVAALAVKGVQNEIKAGTAAGQVFKGDLNLLSGDLKGLEATAAHGILTPFDQAVHRIHAVMPEVNLEVSRLAPLLGDIAGHGIAGVLAGFKNFEPVIAQVLGGVDELAARFEQWSQGPGGAKFAGILSDEFARVGPVFGDTASAAGKLVAALKPVGDAEVEVFGGAARVVGSLADALNNTLSSAGAKAFFKDVVDGAREVESAATDAARSLGDLGHSLGPLLHLGGNTVKATTSLTATEVKAAGVLADGAARTITLLSGHFDKARTTTIAGNGTAALTDAQKAAGALNYAQIQAAASAAQLAAGLGLTVGQAEAAAQKVGLTTAAWTTAKDALAKHADAVAKSRAEMDILLGVSDKTYLAFQNGSAAATTYAAALATFAGSAETTADKAKLIGETLRASQGDALSFTGALAQGTTAADTLANTFIDQAKGIRDLKTQLAQAKPGTTDFTDAQQALTRAFSESERAAIDTKDGLIEYGRAGAGPLVQQLQAMQDAATNAAAAVYQHELATKGDKVAGDDAIKVFDRLTHGALLDNASQLGLTAGQAKLLADQYFAIPPDVSTAVHAIGLADINSTLDRLGQQLSYLTGHPWTVQVGFALNNDVGQLVHDAVNNIGPVFVPTRSGANLPGNAAGTNDWRGGPTWVGEKGPEIVIPPPGSKILPNSTAQKFAASYAPPPQGAAGGGFTQNNAFYEQTDPQKAANETTRRMAMAGIL